MILTRKAAKDYGTKKMIEGIWKKGQNVLVIEDVVTYGDSIAETTAVSFFSFVDTSPREGNG